MAVPTIRITLKNADQIMAKLRKMPVEMTRQLDTAVKKTLALVQNETFKQAPVNKQGGGGNLRQSITSGMLGMARGKLEVGSSYGIYVHEGTKAHIIEVRNKRALANVRTGQMFGKKVNHPAVAPNPFLKRAVENSNDDIQRYFQEAVEKVAKS
jgi:HK97 gp10 family phage protein